jgi:ketosteroid isomerase-like protein
MSAASQTAKAIYAAYATKDRGAAERLLADDFQFVSPLDNRLDRDADFAICWPSSEDILDFEILRIGEIGGEVLVTYEGKRTGGKRFRNTEILTIRDGKISAVEVYFGWNVPHDVPLGRHKDPS